MKKILVIILQFAIVFYSYAQTTYVPDDVFEQKLIYMGLDDVLDDYVLTASIDTVTVLNLGNPITGQAEIQDLTGLQDFVSLKEFYSKYHDFSTLDVSNVPDLEWISIQNNTALSGIDVSNNPNLKHLELWGPSYSFNSLDLSNNTLLEHVSIRYFHNLTNIQVNNLPNLKVLDLFNNSISNININNDGNLEYLVLTMTHITQLDISNNTELKVFIMEMNNNYIQQITFNNPNLQYLMLNDCPNLNALDLSSMLELHTLNVTNTGVSNINFGDISKIKFAYIHDNSQLTQLDFSNFSNLKIMEVNNNSLNFLDVRNGNQIGIMRFKAQNNPSLSNILVDDPNGFYINDWIFDNNVTFTDF